MRIEYWLTMAATVVLISGCMVGPDYERPDVALPEGWSEPFAGGESGDALLQQEWWTVFGDATLDSLVDRAAAGNLDLRTAQARLQEARAFEAMSGAALWPQVNVAGMYQRSQSREIDMSGSPMGSAALTLTPNGVGISVTGMPEGAGGPTVTVVPDLSGSGNSAVTIGSGTGFMANTPDRHTDLYQTGFDATWELDIFGGVRRGQEASRADTQGVEEVLRNVLISVEAEVARNYFGLRSAQSRLATANENIKAQDEALSLAQARFNAGLTNELDVKVAEAQLASSKSVVPALESAIQFAIHRLGVLLGSDPGTLQEELAVATPLAAAPPEVPVGLPVDILRRRPDVRQAERAVAAASARVGVAQADLYPHFVLNGSLTGSSTDFEGITRGANRLWSFGPGIRWPVFDGGRIRANIRVQDARLEQATIVYEKTILTALLEVEDALVAYAKEQNRLVTLTEAVEANRRAVDIARQLYGNGLIAFINVIDAERNLFAGQDQQIQSESLVLTNLVALYKALGGGWEKAYPESATELPIAEAAPAR